MRVRSQYRLKETLFKNGIRVRTIVKHRTKKFRYPLKGVDCTDGN